MQYERKMNKKKKTTGNHRRQYPNRHATNGKTFYRMCRSPLLSLVSWTDFVTYGAFSWQDLEKRVAQERKTLAALGVEDGTGCASAAYTPATQHFQAKAKILTGFQRGKGNGVGEKSYHVEKN